MNTTIELLRYYRKTTFLNTKILAPLLLACIVTAVFYYTPAVHPVDSFAVTILVIFAFQGWITFAFYKEDEVEEQLLFLKCKRTNLYYLSKYLFLFICGCSLSAFMIIYPIIIHCIKGFQFFIEPISFSMMLQAFIMHISSSICSVALLSLLHPRIYQNRKLAMPFAFLLILFVIVRLHFIDSYPILTLPSYLLPPLSSYTITLSTSHVFEINTSLTYGCILLCYSAIYMLVGITIRKKRCFQ